MKRIPLIADPFYCACVTYIWVQPNSKHHAVMASWVLPLYILFVQAWRFLLLYETRRLYFSRVLVEPPRA